MLSLKTNDLDKHAKGMSLHLGYFDTASPCFFSFAAFFLPGHRMKVQIQSSWFPLFDMNPQRFVDIYQATKEDYVPAEVTVYMDRERPSRVVFRRMEEGQR